MIKKNILITGGLGYIGSHLVDELYKRNNYHVTVINRNAKSSPNYEFVKSRVENILDKDLVKCLDELKLEIDSQRIPSYDAIVHLAASISVSESIDKQADYWVNNLISTENILNTMGSETHFIFASTGTAFCPENPYAYSKVGCEQEILRVKPKHFSIFRFFNVSGLTEGISPTGFASHLIRRAAMAAKGIIPSMSIMGDDWDTKDGTAIRDYIHVEDIAKSLANAIDYGPANTSYECLGTGTGYSVKEVIQSMKMVTGVDFPVIIEDRRLGDVASMICPSKYKYISLEHDLDSMCLSAYKGIQNEKKI